MDFKRGDQFYDPKRKRQYIYEGPDDVFEGKHSFISDQGRTFVGDFSDLEKFTDESKFLDIDEMIGYRNAIDNMDQYLGNVHHGGHTLKNEFWEEAQKAVKEVEAYENKVKKRIKHHRMETGVNNNRKVLKNYINDWKNKQNNTNTNTNQNQNTNTNTNTNTNRNTNAYEQAKNNMGSGDTIDLNTGDIKKADGTIIKKDGTIIPPPDTNANANIDPNSEDWDGGANDFDQGASYEEDVPEANTSEMDAPPEEEWFSGYDGADDVPFGAEDFDDEFLANLTDDQILNQARNNEELERYIKMRDDARKRLGMDSQTFNAETESRTINNNFNGVNQERQQQQTSKKNIQGNQEYEIDTDKPWTWTDDDIRTMADGDPDVAIDLMNQREQARQQQQQGQNQQRQTQEQTKNTAEETTGDTSGSSNKETPKGNIDEETLKKRKIERQQRSDRARYANRRLKGKTGEQLKNRSKGALRRGRAKGKYAGKKFKVKGGNLKQAVANTIINEVAEEAIENILHPNMFNSLDQFADMSDDDIQHFADMIENEDLRKQRTKEWKDKRRQARNERKKQQKIDKQEKLEETVNDLHEQYVNGEYKQQIPPDQKAKMNKVEFEVDENGNTIIKKNKLLGGSADGDDIFGWMKKHNIGLGEAINVISTIGTYKDARKQGKGVVSSIASAAGTFVKGELLGFWGSLGWELAKGIPKMAIKGAETLYKENRKMNSAANQQVFGGAQFQDTQQLATMRQSGMEMAKMAQYNLQQTLMGAEATHLHR